MGLGVWGCGRGLILSAQLSTRGEWLTSIPCLIRSHTSIPPHIPTLPLPHSPIHTFPKQRQHDGKRRPGARRALDADGAAVQLDEVFGQRQADAGASVGAAGRAVDLVEALEDARQRLLGDAGAGVAHADDGLPIRLAASLGHGDHDLSACRSKLERVGQQVAQRRAHPLRVEGGLQPVHGSAALERDAPALGQRRVRAHDRLREAGEVAPPALELHPPALQPRQVQHLADELPQAGGAAVGHLELPALLARECAVGVFEHVAERSLDQRQRRAKLVRDVGEELALEAVQLAEALGLRLVFLLLFLEMPGAHRDLPLQLLLPVTLHAQPVHAQKQKHDSRYEEQVEPERPIERTRVGKQRHRRREAPARRRRVDAHFVHARLGDVRGGDLRLQANGQRVGVLAGPQRGRGQLPAVPAQGRGGSNGAAVDGQREALPARRPLDGAHDLDVRRGRHDLKRVRVGGHAVRAARVDHLHRPGHRLRAEDGLHLHPARAQETKARAVVDECIHAVGSQPDGKLPGKPGALDGQPLLGDRADDGIRADGCDARCRRLLRSRLLRRRAAEAVQHEKHRREADDEQEAGGSQHAAHRRGGERFSAAQGSSTPRLPQQKHSKTTAEHAMMQGRIFVLRSGNPSPPNLRAPMAHVLAK